MHHYHRYIHRYITYHINCTCILVDFVDLHFAEFISLLCSYISRCIHYQFHSLFSVSIFPVRHMLESFSNSFSLILFLTSQIFSADFSPLSVHFSIHSYFFHILPSFSFPYVYTLQLFHPNLFSFSAFILQPTSWKHILPVSPYTNRTFHLHKFSSIYRGDSHPIPTHNFFPFLPPFPLFSPFIQANISFGHHLPADLCDIRAHFNPTRAKHD